MNENQNDFDVIVVGAGLAGLIAARDSSQAGLSTLLVEARDRVGGRTNTVEFGGQLVESGGTYFDLDNEPEMVTEFERYGLKTRYTKDEPEVPMQFRTRLNGRTLETAFPIDQAGDLIKVAYQAINDSYRVGQTEDTWMQGTDDLEIPFTDWLSQFDIPRETWEYVNAWVSIYAGNFPTEVSALTVIGEYIAGYDHNPWNWFAGVSHELAGGSRAFRDAILADSPGLTLKLDTPVARVEQTDGSIHITARSGEVFTCRDAVWATPLNTWSDVAFEPALSPAKRGAAATRHIGGHHKLWIRAKNVPEGIYGTSYESAFKSLYHHATLDNGETISFAMTNHTQLDCDDAATVQAEVRKFAPEAEVLETFYENWLDSEFSQGTWLVAPPGFLSKYHGDLDKPEGRLRFAGADVTKDGMSRMYGAVLSGQRAAAQIVSSHVPVG